ncbi:MAG: hypothetical protein RLZZ58_1352, partial [Pseudomonadota bacterium]
LTVNAAEQIVLLSTGGGADDPTVAVTGAASLISGGNVVGSPSSIINAGSLLVQSQTGSVSGGTFRADSGLTILSAGAATLVNALGNDVTITAGGPISAANIFATDDIRLTGGTMTLGTLDTRSGAAGPDTEGDGRNIVITAPGAAVNVIHAEAARNLTATAGSFATGLNSIITGGDIDITTSGGTDLGNSTAGGFVRVISGGTLFNAVSAGTTITLTSTPGINPTNGAATSGAISGVSASAPGAIAITGTGVSTSGLVQSTGGGVTLNATNGPLSLAGVTAATTLTGTSTGAVTSSGALTSGGALSLTGGSITATGAVQSTGGSVTLNATTGALSLGSVNAATSLTGTAPGLISISGIVTGTSVAFASSDIAIGATARIGTSGTTTGISLTNNDANRRTYIGGAGNPSGYSISAAEMARIFGANVTVTAPKVTAIGSASVGSAAPPDLIIDTFAFTGGGAAGGQLGPTGALTLQTTGKARVIGAVTMTSMTDANRLQLIANDALEVIRGSGSIDLRGTGTALGGILQMRSDDIIVATPQAITDVGALVATDNMAAIDDRLALSDGLTDPQGALRARGISATVTNGLYIQNSGTSVRFDDRRGFTFGAGGFAITGLTPGYNIVINGVNIDAAGLTVTGRNVVPLISFPASAAIPGGIRPYDILSTVNGCFINNPAACVEVIPGTPIQDVIKGPVKGDGGSGDNFFLTTLIELRDIDPLAGEPLLDDPVTGAGNDDLWIVPEKDEDEEDAGE